MERKKVMLTGGGTAGHVNPNLSLLPYLNEAGLSVSYVGSKGGIEESLVKLAGIPFFGISSGKLRRYLSLDNVTDAFRVVKGVGDAFAILKKERPDIIFSKGGFVCVPVVLAAFLLRIPVIAHESDVTPGLANKIAYPFAKTICATFAETIPYIPKGKAVLTGTPLRKELFHGKRENALNMCGFDGSKPILLVTGGSLGASTINLAVREALPALTETFDIIHLCGAGKKDDTIKNAGYAQFEYVGAEMKDVLTAADVILSRAGANAIFEFLSLCKPSVLVPLSKKASRGDQILNADIFEKSGYSAVIYEENLTCAKMAEKCVDVYKNREYYIGNMVKVKKQDSARVITELIKNSVKQ
ncbi:UDP-N-acetylglucosamine--N-acetylmuramyl-(pentapeptide) pyrophosphoryl-undecaprenol N-acetylglucosamine transferase [Clostridia bacterium]|nr:UDP-N-acetylglucosamine--N-acetylmuramyl-(pentapeptide) pyrophosphoryl-undecaprenol N-acetylglucosamine transferase [Clostridia bacterium]